MSSEVEKRFDEFSLKMLTELSAVSGELNKNRPIFLQSYARIASLNAWKSYILATRVSREAIGFFIEAQNDALTSHVFARLGAWRSALQALRGCVEDVACCLYYKDHPVELELWHRGAFRIGFTAIRTYLEGHPAFHKIGRSLSGLEGLQQEYATLSRAVHAAVSFRMTGATESTKLWTADKVALGQWKTRETLTLRAINSILLTMYRQHLQGAKLPLLRQGIAITLSPAKITEIKKNFSVSL